MIIVRSTGNREGNWTILKMCSSIDMAVYLGAVIRRKVRCGHPQSCQRLPVTVPMRSAVCVRSARLPSHPLLVARPHVDSRPAATEHSVPGRVKPATGNDGEARRCEGVCCKGGCPRWQRVCCWHAGQVGSAGQAPESSASLVSLTFIRVLV